MTQVFIVRNWFAIILLLVLEATIGTFYHVLPGFQTSFFSETAVAMLATVVGLFLALRFNNAYDRWWEARILWGQMVNNSRSFARQVTTLLRERHMPEPGTLQTTQRRLVMRQVAIVNALRLRLRGQDDQVEELAPFLSKEELDETAAHTNRPTTLIRQQGRELADLLGRDTKDTVLLARFDATLSNLLDVQGGCDRIKGTAFPDDVRALTLVLVWGIALLIPVVFLEADEPMYFIKQVGVLFVAVAFFVVYQLSLELMNPFENRANDTPMTAICINIERDLRELIGDTELPPPSQPVNGILM
ncbi:MAG: bestrophin family ion channel [Pseudomonadota bacterium]